ncbi:MAG: hypothetical protein WBL70_03900 [Candidatus Acidiferrales bacterium]
MEKEPDLLKEYLDRLRVREKSASVEEYSERLSRLSATRSLLTTLTTRGFIVSEGPTLLSSAAAPPPVGPLGLPDYVILKEDVLLYIYLSLTKNRAVSAAFLRAISDALRENPNLSGVLLVWPENDFASLAIDSFTVRNYLERTEPIDLSGEETAPLNEAVENFFNSQFVDWAVTPSIFDFGRGERIFHLADLLRENLRKGFEAEKARNLEIPEKIEALRLISPEDVNQILSKITAVLSQKEVKDRDLRDLEDLIESLAKT